MPKRELDGAGHHERCRKAVISGAVPEAPQNAVKRMRLQGCTDMTLKSDKLA